MTDPVSAFQSARPHALSSSDIPDIKPLNGVQAQTFTQIVDIIVADPTVIEALSLTDFETVLCGVHQVNHPRGNEVYSLLLKNVRMAEISQLRLDLQALDLTKTLPQISADLVQRMNIFLNTKYAEKISPLHLKQLYENYTREGRDTLRIKVLLGPVATAEMDGIIHRTTGDSSWTLRNWCSFV
jgi:hypothetical protein